MSDTSSARPPASSTVAGANSCNSDPGERPAPTLPGPDTWTLNSSAHLREARALGHFKVINEYATGGFGRVSVAFDGKLGRQIALKEIRPDRRDERAVLERFVREAELTGQLQHPGIVPVYAMDRDEQGQPYYVMRFIHGRTLGEGISEYHASPSSLLFNDLLRRLVSVCQTVAYAHSQGIIHRDLKPANIMLGEYGETLVLDWGLAKRLGEKPSEQGGPRAHPESMGVAPTLETVDMAASDDALTQAGQILGTPAYMAPEQADGEPAQLSPSTDIYALGAILYHLLTGQAPYSPGSAVEVVARVRQGPPPRPSMLNRGVPRGLESVCLKAMNRQPNERYASAADLAQEIERWLAGEPLQTYREPLLDRVARWVRRNQALAAGAVLLVLLALPLAVALALVRERALRQADRDRVRIQQEQRNASRQAARHQKASQFYEKYVLAAARPRGEGAGRDVTLKDALDLACLEINRAFADHPEDEAAVCNVLGHTYFTLAEYARAEELTGRAVSLRRALLGERHRDTVDSRLNLLDVLMETDRNAEARDHLDGLLPLVEATYGKEDELTLKTQYYLLMVLSKLGKTEDLIRRWEDLLRLEKLVLGEKNYYTLMTRNNLGWTWLRKEAQPELAVTIFRSLLDELTEKTGAERRIWMYASNGLGASLRSKGEYEEAIAVLTDLWATQQVEFGPTNRDTLRTRTNLADVLIDSGKFKDAEGHLREVERGYVADYTPEYIDLFTSVYQALIRCLEKQGNGKAAEEYRTKLGNRVPRDGGGQRDPR